MRERKWLNGRDYQSRIMKNEVSARESAVKQQEISNQLKREFGYDAFLELQSFNRVSEQSQIQEFIENNKEDKSKFQQLPYANGWRVTSSLDQ
jgi:hypothetical protein